MEKEIGVKNGVIILLLNILMFAHVNEYLKQYTYTLVFEETFQTEDGSLKDKKDLTRDWEVKDLHMSNITSQGRYEFSGEFYSKKEFCQYKLEFHMAPKDAETFGVLARGGDLRVKFINGDYDKFAVIVKDHEQYASFPEGFDLSILNKYSLYDNGACVSIFVNDIHLFSTDLKDKDAAEKGFVGFFSENGIMTVDNIDVYSMNPRNPKTRDDFLVLCLIAFAFLSYFFVKIRIEK